MNDRYIFSKNLRLLLLKNHYLVINDINNDDIDNSNLALGIVNSFLSIGYKLSESAFNILKRCDASVLTAFYINNFSILKEIKGSKKHVVFYKNFPDLDDVDDYEYIIRAELHYLTANESEYGFINDDIKIKKREDGAIKVPYYDEIDILVKTDAISYLRNYISNLFSSNTAINRNLFDSIKEFRKKYSLLDIKEIPFKENIAIYAYTKADNKNIDKNELKYATTITDVLRIYYMISNNQTVFDNVKFISLNRKSRRNILNRLEKIVTSKGDLINGINDFYLHEKLWKSAFNYLHVFEYKNKYKMIYQIADTIRNGKSLSFNAILEKEKNNQENYLKILQSKPGEFARKLNYLILNPNYDLNLTLKYFEDITAEVSTKVLLELYTYFMNRDSLKYRLFKIPTSFYTKFYQRDVTLSPLSEETKNRIISIIKKSLEDKYESYEKIEDVYVDPALKDVILPPVIRNSSLNFDGLIFGSKIKLTNNEFLRVFTTWKNEKKERIDIDLALEMFDENFNQIGNLSWHNMLGGKGIDARHSGDLITAPLPLGATEFIDINLFKARKKVRYLLVTNTMYSGLTFKELSYCYSGVMLSDTRLKKLYDEKAVYIKSKLNQESGLQNIAFVIDLLNLELIWVDMPYCDYYGSVTYESLGVKSILIDVLRKRMSIYDFIMLHKKHMSFVTDINKSKVIIGPPNKANINSLNFETLTKDLF